MKKLITILFLLVTANSFAYQTHEEIDAIKVNDVLFQLLQAVYPDCEYKVDEPNPFEFEFLINVLETEECAATLPQLTTRLDLYKTNQHAILTYRTVLNAKKLEAKTLFLSIKNLYHSAAKKAGLPNIPNPAAWVRDNCQRVITHELVDSCLVKLNKVNDKIAEVQAEHAYKDALKTAKKALSCGENVITVMMVRNAMKTLTTGDIRTMALTFANIKAMLDTGSLVTAREDIVNVDLTGTKMDEDDRAALLAEIDSCKP